MSVSAVSAAQPLVLCHGNRSRPVHSPTPLRIQNPRAFIHSHTRLGGALTGLPTDAAGTPLLHGNNPPCSSSPKLSRTLPPPNTSPGISYQQSHLF